MNEKGQTMNIPPLQLSAFTPHPCLFILLPVPYDQDDESSEYFECVAEDGTIYRLKDWTDDEFNKASMMSACKDDNTTAEDLFDV